MREALSPSCHTRGAWDRTAALLLIPTSSVAAVASPVEAGPRRPGLEPNQTGLGWTPGDCSRSPRAGAFASYWPGTKPLPLPQSCRLNARSQVPASGKGDTTSRFCFHPLLSKALSFFQGRFLPTQVPGRSLQQPLSPLSEQRRGRRLLSCLLFHFSAMHLSCKAGRARSISPFYKRGI